MGPVKRGVTLKDIAEQTGFSINTVSRVLRDQGDIAESTRRTILDAADSLGHVRNMRASSLRSGVTYTIAVILGDVSNPHFAILMNEIEHYARRQGYTTFLLTTDEDEQLELAAIQTALKQSVDGVILCPAQKTTRNVEYLQQSGVPFVLIGRRFANLSTNSVVCNDALGGYQATRRLLEGGHRDILLLGGPPYISSAAERKQGYLRAHVEIGITPKPELQQEVPITGDGCKQVLERLLLCDVSFTAIFAFSDSIAWKCWSYLEQRGLHVPADISLIGFDYIHSQLELPFQVTSIASHKRRMSAAAVELLLEVVKSDWEKRSRTEEQTVINTALCEGQTVRNLTENNHVNVHNTEGSHRERGHF